MLDSNLNQTQIIVTVLTVNTLTTFSAIGKLLVLFLLFYSKQTVLNTSALVQSKFSNFSHVSFLYNLASYFSHFSKMISAVNLSLSNAESYVISPNTFNMLMYVTTFDWYINLSCQSMVIINY